MKKLWKYREIAEKVIKNELNSLDFLHKNLNYDAFDKVVDALLKNKDNKIILSGLGKSGFIAKKISSTFNSTGTKSVFLHPTEALHGDIGVCEKGDIFIILSKSGNTQELLQLISIVKKLKFTIIAIVGNLSSPIAKMADYVLNACILREADEFDFVPTSSTTASLVLGDAIACTLMQIKKFGKNDFLKFHPGGHLGQSLSKKIGDLIHDIREVACVSVSDSLREIVIELTKKPLGAAFVMSNNKQFLGLITDGDVRRSLKSKKFIDEITANDIMTVKPIVADVNLNMEEALHLMENRKNQLNVLPIFNAGKCIGLFRLHDAYKCINYDIKCS